SRAAFRQSLMAGALFLLVGLLGAAGSGHLHTQYLAQANPMKLASMEALWETADPAPFAIVADIDEQAHENRAELEVPALFSFMLYNQPAGAVRGINDLQATAEQQYGPGDYRPDVTGLFWSFRLMVGIGGVMIGLAFLTFLLAWKGDPLRFPWLLRLIPWLLPLVYIVNSCGWYVAEAGRQPWIVVGLQKTAEAVSPNLSGAEVWLTLLGFTVTYLLLAGVALYLAFRFVRHTVISYEGRA
ncbi:MAG: cytochrome ubiquinol oxidase subunit I, partial [Selenomonas sp.]|nr:cytochrome ubiquinol oxidase subunit I [Selenomonas sp.]